MSKSLIFSDLHCHNHKDKNDRLQDCVQVLDWIFATAKKHSCKYIFFLGDLFHERAKIDVLNYLKTFESFMRHAADFEVILLVGNHDMYHKERWDVNSVKPLSAFPNIKIIESPTTTEIDGRRIDWLPHSDNPLKYLEDFPNKRDILFAHLAVHGAMMNTCHGIKADVIIEHDHEMIPVDKHVFGGWHHVFLGHYHGAQKLADHIEYVGSPLQLSFGEAFQQKHIILFDLETSEKQYIINEFSPKHFIVSPTDIENETYDLKNHFVRVAVEDLGKKDLIDLQRKIIKELCPLSLDLKQVEKKLDDALVISDAKAILNDTKKMLEQYVNDKGLPTGLNREKLLKIGEKCLDAISS